MDFEIAAHVSVENGELPFEQRRKAPSRKGNAGVRSAAGKTTFAHGTWERRKEGEKDLEVEGGRGKREKEWGRGKREEGGRGGRKEGRTGKKGKAKESMKV